MRYFVDRFSRVYVTLIPCLGFVLLADWFFSDQVPDFELGVNSTLNTLLKNVLLMPSMPYGTMRPIWSLMFEWWIYVLFGAAIFFRKNWFFSIVCAVLGGYYTFEVNAKGQAGHLEVIWLAGAIAAAIFEKIRRCAYSQYVAVASLIVSTVIYLWTCDAYNIAAGLLFSFGLLFLAISFDRVETAVSQIKVRWIGVLAGYSFTLFLTHYTVLYWLGKFGFSGVDGILLGLLLSNLIACFIASLTEVHHKKVSMKIMHMMAALRAGAIVR